MNIFTLFFPVSPWKVNQNFAECSPEVCQKYHELGLNGHNGIDVWAPDSHPVYAAHDGEVTFAGEDGSAGIGIVIRTTEQFTYAAQPAYFKTIYWHLKKGSLKVKAGDRVNAGHLIALADNSGLSTGSHLHFGLKPVYQGEQDWEWFNVAQDNGYKGAIDPAPYFNGYYAKDAQKTINLLKMTVAALKKYIAYLLAK